MLGRATSQRRAPPAAEAASSTPGTSGLKGASTGEHRCAGARFPEGHRDWAWKVTSVLLQAPCPHEPGLVSVTQVQRDNRDRGNILPQNQCLKWGHAPPKAHLVMSGHLLGCHTGAGREGEAGHLVGRGQGRGACPTRHMTAPNKELSGPEYQRCQC